VYFNAFDGLGDDDNAIIRVPIDGSTAETRFIPDAHHDFWLHDDGTLAVIVADGREVDGATVHGDRLMEIDPDGDERDVWSTWDSFTFDPATSPQTPEGWWTIANTLEYLPDRDSYVVSLRNLDTLVEIDRTTGRVGWTVGPDGTYVPDDPFAFQHGFDVLDDGLLIFDNGRIDRQESRAARYVFEDGVARLVWQYTADPALYSFIMGDAHLLANGNVTVTFSTAATVHEVDPDGALVASFSYDVGAVFGFPDRWDSLVE
jgi:hypothetical protein